MSPSLHPAGEPTTTWNTFVAGPYLYFEFHRHVRDRTRHRRRPRHRPAKRRLPPRRVDRARLLPRHQARQAGPCGRSRRRWQDRARESAGNPSEQKPRQAPVLRGPGRGEGAVRVELPQAAAPDPDRSEQRRLAGRAGGHLRRGVPAAKTSHDGDRKPRTRRPPDRRDRQDRPGVRGDAARAALRLPDQHSRARPDRGEDAAGGPPHLQQHARAHRGAEAALPVSVARLPRPRARAPDRPPPRARPRREPSPAS